MTVATLDPQILLDDRVVDFELGGRAWWRTAPFSMM